MNVLALKDIVVEFPVSAGGRREVRRALDGVSLEVRKGESFGIVGESGSGKTTVANVVLGLVTQTSGTLHIEDVLVPLKRTPQLQRKVQMVFQDPASSLNPRRRVGSILNELLKAHRLVSASGATERMEELMGLVGLPANVLNAFPRELSGGQRQRVAIARALAVEPEILVADEAVSALDVSAQAKVINLLADLRDEFGLTLIFISHDLAVVRTLCDRVAVMNAGRIVETGDIKGIFTDPKAEYTQQLISAIPGLRNP